MCLSIKVKNPDCVLAEGEHEGIEWVVVHNRNGFRCGYARVPKGHPWHGLHYDDVEPHPEVHGGLTFAEPDMPCDKGGPDDAWWFGFDCAHGWDAPDPELVPAESWVNRLSPGFFDHTCVVRDQEYVENECRKLCEAINVAG